MKDFRDIPEPNLSTVQNKLNRARQQDLWGSTLQRAIDKWGAETQTDKAIEEIGELLQAIMKHRHKPYSEERHANLLEEIADVEIVLEQLRRIYDDHDTVPQIKVVKMFRLIKILDAGGAY